MSRCIFFFNRLKELVGLMRRTEGLPGKEDLQKSQHVSSQRGTTEAIALHEASNHSLGKPTFPGELCGCHGYTAEIVLKQVANAAPLLLLVSRSCHSLYPSPSL